ncbi:MAG: hypothetical protein L6R36_002207 [Xanthoria steineri]|nr:MAG: hypothetical protein L6R36_002207 [Xanthoria steineri]
MKMLWGAVALTLAFTTWISLSAAAGIIAQNRKYDIRDCGTFTDQVEVALDLRKGPLDAAINAAKLGVKSPHGFRAFFKDDAAIPKVTEILKNIQSMRGLRRLIPYPNPWTAQLPVFVCVNESTRQRYGTRLRRDPYEYCQQSGGFGLYLFGWKYIFLCDKLFTLRPAPLAPPLKNCPHVIGNRFAVPAEMGRLADFQTYVLIHEMMHFYLLRDSLGWNSIPKESYASNVCVNFDMKTSLRNPMNLQCFVAMVDNKCTEAPNPFLPPFPLPPPKVVEEEQRSNASVTIDAAFVA